MPLVETVRNETTGRKIVAAVVRMLTNLKESSSARLMAIFLGTSSPKIREKYDSRRVIKTVEIPLITEGEKGRPARAAARLSEKFSDATADERNPASVTPI